jgi:secernin
MARMQKIPNLFLLVTITVLLPLCTKACDTWVALGDVTEAGVVMLGKNSDRPKFDCQPLELHPRQEWPDGSQINLGRVMVPQVAETYATLGSSPYWCWGYEEGINEYGVTIGNEGVWTRPLVEHMEASLDGETIGLGPTGMDLLRLGLERAKTAREALDVITGLLETHGQFGSGIPTMGVPSAYDNSFIIADPSEAWILETAGTEWVARRISQGSASISNKLSIGAEYDLASSRLVDYAIQKGWWQNDAGVFDFNKAYSADTPGMKERQERAGIRQARSCALLDENSGKITLGSMKQIARDRNTDPGIDLDQTASSCVAVLPPAEAALPVFWWCPARPSNSCYVPFFVHGGILPETVTMAGTYGARIVPPSEAEADSFSPDSYWWLFRDLTDKVAADRDKRLPVVREQFDRLEAQFAAGLTEVLADARRLRQAGDHLKAASRLDAYTASCVEQAVATVNDLREHFAAEVIEIPAEYRPYVGTYIGNFAAFRDAEFEVKLQNGHLAVDVPGQMVFELNEPDEEGLWYFRLTNLVAVSFESDDVGGIVGMSFHQTSELPRKSEAAVSGDIPEDYRPYVGTYTVPMGTREVEVLFEEGRLALDLPDQAVIELEQPDQKGRWYFAIDPTTSVSFTKDETGEVIKLAIHQIFVLPRAR